jgi:hypothetical protein
MFIVMIPKVTFGFGQTDEWAINYSRPVVLIAGFYAASKSFEVPEEDEVSILRSPT